MKVTPFFRWFDLWIGAYVDVDKRTLYVCPLPTIGLKIELTRKPPRPFLAGDRVTWTETDEDVTVDRVAPNGVVWVRFDDSDQQGWIDARELRHATGART